MPCRALLRLWQEITGFDGKRKYFPSPLIATLNLPICLFLFVMGYNCFRRALQSDIVFEVAQIKTHFSHQIFFRRQFSRWKKKNPPCAILHIFTPFLSFESPSHRWGRGPLQLLGGKNEITIIIWLIGGALSRSKVSSRFALVRSASGLSNRDQGEGWRWWVG